MSENLQQLPYEIFLLGVVFFGGMGVINFIRAYRKREGEYYFGSLIGFLVVVMWILLILEQILPMLVLTAIVVIVSVWRLPKINKIVDRELREMDISSPLRARDFLTYGGWLKLAKRWGVWKAACIYFLLAIAVIGGMLYISSTIYQPYGTTIWFVVSITITTSTVATLMFYQHLKKALK